MAEVEWLSIALEPGEGSSDLELWSMSARLKWIGQFAL